MNAFGYRTPAAAVSAPAAPRTAGRRFFSAAELRQPAPPSQASWAAVSIAVLCLAAVLLSPATLSVMNGYLVLLGLLVLLGARSAPPRELVLVVLPFFAMIAVGVLRGFADAPTYAFLRDGWYFSNPVMVISVGYLLGRHTGITARGLRGFVLGGTGVALLHLSWFLRFPELFDLRAIDVRGYIGTGYFAAVLGLLILLGHIGRWRAELRLPPWLAGVCLLLTGASVVLSFSRTLALVLLVGSLAMAGFFGRHLLWRLLLLAVLVVAAVLVVRTVIDPMSQEARTSQLGKFGRAIEELSITDKLSRNEIADNWRGYETARALGQWSAGGASRWLLGEGLGALVDLGLFQNLNRNPRDAVRFIPIFHNGYMFLLVKTGLLGVGLYLVFLARLYWLGRRQACAASDSPDRRLGRMMQACAATLAVSTAIWFGTFHKFDLLPVMLMIGFLLSRQPAADNEASA